MQDVQQAVRHVEDAKRSFVQDTSGDDDVLRAKLDTWREADKRLSDLVRDSYQQQPDSKGQPDPPPEQQQQQQPPPTEE